VVHARGIRNRIRIGNGNRSGGGRWLIVVLLTLIVALFGCSGPQSGGTQNAPTDGVPANSQPDPAASGMAATPNPEPADKCALLTREEAAATGATGEPRPGVVSNGPDCSWTSEDVNAPMAKLELAAIYDRGTVDRVWGMYEPHTQQITDGPPGTRIGSNGRNLALMVKKGDDRMLIMTGVRIDQAHLAAALTAAYGRL